MAVIETDLIGFQEFRNDLRRIGRTGIKRPQKKFLRRAGVLARQAFRRQFTTRGSEFGTPWPPLSKATLARKRRGGWPATPMVRTTRLRASLTSKAGEHNEVIRSDTLELESFRPSRRAGSLVAVHEAGVGRQRIVRRLTHPQTGIAGAKLREIELDLEKLLNDIADLLEKGEGN